MLPAKMYILRALLLSSSVKDTVIFNEVWNPLAFWKVIRDSKFQNNALVSCTMLVSVLHF
jgi:hypothetical protein